MSTHLPLRCKNNSREVQFDVDLTAFTRCHHIIDKASMTQNLNKLLHVHNMMEKKDLNFSNWSYEKTDKTC